MIEKRIRISAEEALEIACYGLDNDIAEKLKRHYRIYNDWNRLKDLLQKELVAKKQEFNRLRDAYKKVQARAERYEQTETFPCYANGFHSANGGKIIVREE